MRKMISKFLCLVLIISVALVNFNCSNKKEEKMLETKPIYELFIDAKGCFYEILINDVPVYFHYNIGATAFRLPINSFIPKKGIQKISLRMISVAEGKPFPQGAEVTFNIDEYPQGFPRERRTVFTYKTAPFEEKNKGIFASEKEFYANVPYELVNWQNGIDLSKENKDKLKNELGKIYQEYTDVFKNKDLSKYKELIELRQENIFKSMYYTKEQKAQAEKSYIGGIQNETVKLYPLENYQLVFYGNGKLVGLRKKDDAPGIFIDNENQKDAFIEYILFYRKTPGSPLKIIL